MIGKTNPKLIFYIFLIVLFVFSVFFYIYSMKQSSTPINDYESLSIHTDKEEYDHKDKAIIIIENISDNNVCFSSCYPFYIQKKDMTWENFKYGQCLQKDVAETCINPYGKKAFEVSLEDMGIASANHRFVVTACLNCNIGDDFRIDEIFFSNEFKVD